MGIHGLPKYTASGAPNHVYSSLPANTQYLNEKKLSAKISSYNIDCFLVSSISAELAFLSGNS